MLKLTFSLINSNFREESINLNFPLVLVILRTLLRLSGRITGLISPCYSILLKFTCSFLDNLNYADFSQVIFETKKQIERVPKVNSPLRSAFGLAPLAQTKSFLCDVAPNSLGLGLTNSLE